MPPVGGLRFTPGLPARPRIEKLTANAGLAAISELCDRLGVIEALDAAVGPIKQRDRGFGAGQLLAGIAAAQLAGEDFLAGPDRQRADAAGQQITPVPGLSSTTAAGLARRMTAGQWKAVERGVVAVTQRMLELLPAPRAAALAEGRSRSSLHLGQQQPADRRLQVRSGAGRDDAADLVQEVRGGAHTSQKHPRCGYASLIGAKSRGSCRTRRGSVYRGPHGSRFDGMTPSAR
jgi:hypothetical protein